MLLFIHVRLIFCLFIIIMNKSKSVSLIKTSAFKNIIDLIEKKYGKYMKISKSIVDSSSNDVGAEGFFESLYNTMPRVKGFLNKTFCITTCSCKKNKKIPDRNR